MAFLAKPFAVLAVTIVVAACASGPTPSPIGSPSAAALPSAAEGASPFACDGGTSGCAGNLTAGVHSTSNLVIPTQFTVPNGWVNIRDITRTYELSTPSGLAGPIEVLALNAIADQGSCGLVPLAGAGSAVQDFIDFVSGHPGLNATAPAPATIDGYQGQSIDFGVRSDWTAMCPDIDSIDPVVLMLTSTNTDPPGRDIAYAQDVRVRWIVLDVAGETVIVEMVAPAGQFDTEMTEEQPIVDSLDFTPGG